ncbi:hypothetical protein L798_11620 [Zootermopsis nevadensis]|uniref:Uncharacterized protein n=2 Tax=Zootermopsis nevadensis TaxID=136037 RepID=A0A067R7V9_ZOONE|nr:hypothetical protein L798_11620 [Zootermopsis nevadensis]
MMFESKFSVREVRLKELSCGFGSKAGFLRPARDFVAAPGMARAQLNIPGRRVPASRILPSVAPETPESEVLQGNTAVPSSPRSKRRGGGGLGAEKDARNSSLRTGAYDDDDRAGRTPSRTLARVQLFCTRRHKQPFRQVARRVKKRKAE